MTNITPPLHSPKAIADAGEKIYSESLKEKLEATELGRFVAINVRTAEATLGDSPEEALELAKQKDPNGLFHLIKVGSAGVFQIGYTCHGASSDWLYR